eukprot:gene52681-50565_t
MRTAVLAALAAVGGAAQPGSVYGVLDRTVGEGQRGNFALSFAKSCPGAAAPCYHVDATGGKVSISATGANELTAGLGYYLRQHCNMTIGWPRGGGSHVTPGVSRRRTVPWSYIMNVCTHSYSLAWYSWSDWTRFLDWMALSGINNFLAMTGQEEVQYKVFQQLGINDTAIRSWFNGPALLTWSRGQNEYGSNIAGPLPRSFMQSQWALQKQILTRARSLGMHIRKDSNMTDNKKGTVWIDSLDPLFSEIADAWMKVMTEDFGTDHWYQLDGYSEGSWGIPQKCAASPTLTAAMGLNRTDPDAVWSFQGWAFVGLGLRAVWSFQGWAFVGWTDAVWSFQGWAFVGWKSAQQEAALGGFSVIDMSTDGDGEWKKWRDAAFFGAKYIWTTLHDFGGTDAIKGNISHINEIPFAAMKPEADTNVWGTGFTPEGIDQNPVYYEFMTEQHWRSARVPDIPAHVPDANVAAAWRTLATTAYTQDLSAWSFASDRTTPSAT